jgi:putative toxin-antitoxin system antitoxin component (TIGR02293 family)
MSAAIDVLPGLLGQGDRPVTPAGLAADVEKGLTLATLERVANAVAPDDSGFIHRLVPRATLIRRRAQPGARLTIEESARVVRLAAVWALAEEVWKDDAAARRWMFKPHMLLADRRPIDVVLASEFGRPLVEKILGGLLYGTAV